jgi:hypothetical protein
MSQPPKPGDIVCHKTEPKKVGLHLILSEPEQQMHGAWYYQAWDMKDNIRTVIAFRTLTDDKNWLIYLPVD